MIAYKGFTKDLIARLGRGEYQFKVGEKAVEDSSKTVRSGFHCCENPFECLTYYPLNGENRFFKVEASGSIDEDEGERIACTELTPLEELSVIGLAFHGMEYMVNHPNREKWQQRHMNCEVRVDEAEAETKDAIAIARGRRPMVKGVIGSVLGLLVEPEFGRIQSARLFVCKEEQAGKWYTLNENRELEECYEKESS